MTTEKTEILSPSRIERILEMACAYNAQLSVSTESRGETYHFTSHMIEISDIPGAKHIIINYPITDGPAVALKADMELTLSFAVDEGQFTFESTVIRKGALPLKGRPDMTVLEISYPNLLKHSQRRDHLRVSIPTEGPIQATCTIIAAHSGEEPEKAGASSHGEAQFEGNIENISVGGVLLSVKEEPAITSLRAGVTLLLRFLLVESETPIELMGIVKRMYDEDSIGERQVAIEFTNTEETFEYRLAVNRLYKYIAERQRQMLNQE